MRQKRTAGERWQQNVGKWKISEILVTRISTYTAQEYLAEEAHGSEMPACTLFLSYMPWHWVCIHPEDRLPFSSYKGAFHSLQRRCLFRLAGVLVVAALADWGKLKLCLLWEKATRSKLILLC